MDRLTQFRKLEQRSKHRLLQCRPACQNHRRLHLTFLLHRLDRRSANTIRGSEYHRRDRQHRIRGHRSNRRDNSGYCRSKQLALRKRSESDGNKNRPDLPGWKLMQIRIFTGQAFAGCDFLPSTRAGFRRLRFLPFSEGELSQIIFCQGVQNEMKPSRNAD